MVTNITPSVLQCQLTGPRAQHLELTGSLYHVRQVIGSNYSDRIVGNEKPNVLNGGVSGTDYLEGKNGTDTYIVEDGSGLTVIN